MLSAEANGSEISQMIAYSNWNILWTYTRFSEFIGTAHMVSIYGRKYDVMFKYIEINSSGQNPPGLYHNKPVTDFN